MVQADRAIGWGLIGAGAIAGQFAGQLVRVPDARVAAVLSRTPARAQAFAARFPGARAYTALPDLLADRAVAVVYIATPAETHRDIALAALDAGKAVLCEKPFATSAADARAIADKAAAKAVFCMEAMWLRFNPLVQAAIADMRAGNLGTIGHFSAQAGYRSHPNRLRAAAPGRGALLNFGVYGVALAHALFGPPDAVTAQAVRDENGLDLTVTATLAYPGHLAAVSAAVGATLSNEAVITGTKRRLRLGAPFFNPGFVQEVDLPPPADPETPGAVAVPGPGLIERLPYGGLMQGAFLASLLRGRGRIRARPRGANGLRREAEEVMRCLAAGETESPLMPLADSIAVMATLDAIRGRF